MQMVFYLTGRHVIMFLCVLKDRFTLIKILSFMLSTQLCRTNLALNCTLKLKVERRAVKGTIEIIANPFSKKN